MYNNGMSPVQLYQMKMDFAQGVGKLGDTIKQGVVAGATLAKRMKEVDYIDQVIHGMYQRFGSGQKFEVPPETTPEEVNKWVVNFATAEEYRQKAIEKARQDAQITDTESKDPIMLAKPAWRFQDFDTYKKYVDDQVTRWKDSEKLDTERKMFAPAATEAQVTEAATAAPVSGTLGGEAHKTATETARERAAGTAVEAANKAGGVKYQPQAASALVEAGGGRAPATKTGEAYIKSHPMQPQQSFGGANRESGAERFIAQRIKDTQAAADKYLDITDHKNYNPVIAVEEMIRNRFYKEIEGTNQPSESDAAEQVRKRMKGPEYENLKKQTAASIVLNNLDQYEGIGQDELLRQIDEQINTMKLKKILPDRDAFLASVQGLDLPVLAEEKKAWYQRWFPSLFGSQATEGPAPATPVPAATPAPAPTAAPKPMASPATAPKITPEMVAAARQVLANPGAHPPKRVENAKKVIAYAESPAR